MLSTLKLKTLAYQPKEKVYFLMLASSLLRAEDMALLDLMGRSFIYESSFAIINQCLFYSHGKTTLLRHIVSRALQIPPSIDVLLCEQEVVADDTPAVQAILKAYIKRTTLLEEAEKLEKEPRKGNLKVLYSLNNSLLQFF